MRKSDRGRRRNVLRLLVEKAGVMILAAVALACSAPTPAPEPPPAAEQVTRGGTFVFGARGGAQHLNWYAEMGGAAGVTFGPIYEPLVNFDYQPGKDFRADFKVVPWLAESWQRTDDTTYVFKIRPNAVWHDGQPVTAADVLFSYEYLRDPKNNFIRRSQLDSVDKIEQIDQKTVRMTTRGIAPGLLRELAEPSVSIYAKHVGESGRKYEEVAIASGPFKLESYSRATGATYVKNEQHWMSGSPYIDRIKVTWPLDNSALLAAFATGQNDILQLQDIPQLDTAKAIAPNIQYGEYVSDNEDALYMRVDRRPFNDVRVRRAIHLTVDRQGLMGIIMQGKGVLNPPAMNGARTGWVIPQEELAKLPGYRQPKEQDIAEAKRLLAEAGYPQGLKFELKYNQTHSRTPRWSEVVSEQLRAAGIQAELKPLERGAFTRDQKEGNFDAILNTIGKFEPLADWRAAFHSKGGLNGGQIKDPDLDRLLDQLDTTVDDETGKRIFIDFQRLLLDRVYAVSTASPIAFAAWQPWVKDYVFNAAGQSYPRNWAILKLDLNKVPKDR